MLKFSPCKLGLNLLFLKWVTKKSKHLEGQVYPAVGNIWDLACQHGNQFCLQAFMSSIVESLHRLSSMYSLQMIFSELWGSGKQLEGLRNCLCTFLAQMSNVLKFNTDRT